MHVWMRRPLDCRSASLGEPLRDPGFDFYQVPDDTPGCQRDALWKLAALLHFIDGRVGQWHDLPELVAADHAPFKI